MEFEKFQLAGILYELFSHVSRLIFRAQSIEKLCEFGGELPDEYESDCYKDVDESDYACKEKYRIMVSIILQLLESLQIQHKYISFHTFSTEQCYYTFMTEKLL